MKEIIDLTKSSSSSSSNSSRKRRNAKKTKKNKANTPPLIPLINPSAAASVASVASVAPTPAPVAAQEIIDLTSRDPNASYRPSVNESLISLNSRNSNDDHHISACNIEKFTLSNIATEPLEILVKGRCEQYFSPVAKTYLLQQLKKNKHVSMRKLIVPNQNSNNCWFNCFFVAFFISDGGRKFFHFFRTLMIKGELFNREKIPQKIRKGFALLNYCIESCLTGAPYAQHMNTNVIVHYLYESMKHFPNILDHQNNLPQKNMTGNSTMYLMTMINYLSLKSIRIKNFDAFRETRTLLDGNTLFAETAVIKQDSITQLKLIENGKPPDLLIFAYDTHYMKDRHKYYLLEINQYKYKLDTIISSAKHQSGRHVSALLTINRKFYLYDGAGVGVKLKECNWKPWLNVSDAADFKIGENRQVFNLNKDIVSLYYYRVK